jgi:biopolymer transport protein ExbD
MQGPSAGGDVGGHTGAAIYRGMRGRGGPQALGEINVTPLVDVVLVLLLVFMVTAPMMSRGIDVTLPVANQPHVDPEDRLTVSVNAEGRIYVGDKPVNLVLLEDRLRGLLQGRASKVVYLRADARLAYGRVIEVVDKLKSAGVEQIGFVYDLPQERASR